MANWRKTRYPGIYAAHSKSCPAYADAAARCRCKPSWRGRAWDSAGRRAVWSRASKSRGEALAWHAAMTKGADHLAELAKVGPTFEALGEQWLDGVERGHIGRRRGRGKAYSDTTIAGMRRSCGARIVGLRGQIETVGVTAAAEHDIRPLAAHPLAREHERAVDGRALRHMAGDRVPMQQRRLSVASPARQEAAIEIDLSAADVDTDQPTRRLDIDDFGALSVHHAKAQIVALDDDLIADGEPAAGKFRLRPEQPCSRIRARASV